MFFRFRFKNRHKIKNFFLNTKIFFKKNKKMIKKTDCIVLNSRKYSESSKIVNVYSLDYGKLTLMAKGAISPKSKFMGLLEILNIIEINFYFKPNRDMHTLSSADTNIRLKKIKQDLDSSACGLICCELINKTQNQGEINPELYNILLNALLEIESGYKFRATLNFMISLISNIGYELSIDNNLLTNQLFFDLNNGHINNFKGIKLESSYSDALLNIINKNTYELDIKKNEFIKIYNILIRYIKLHLDRNIIINSIELLN